MVKKSVLGLVPFLVWLAPACGDEAEPGDAHMAGSTSGGSGGGTGIGSGGKEFVVGSGGGSGGTPASGGGGSGGGTQPTSPLDYCVFDGVPTEGDPELGVEIDDFDDGDAFVVGNGKHGNWYGYGDEGGSQTPNWGSDADWLPETGGLSEGGYALHAVGSGYDEWGSGQGLSLGWNESKYQNCLFDASGYDGISFWIRGEIVDEEGLVGGEDSGVLKFGVVEPDVVPVEEGGNCTGAAGGCWDWHKVRVELDECWHKHSVRFDELEQDGWGADGEELDLNEIVNLNFEVSQGHRYDYWLDEVSFFVGETPLEEELCDTGMGGAGGVAGAAGAEGQ